MISSILGAVIMSAATVAMLVALNISNQTLKKVGKHPITEQEKEILINAGFTSGDIDLVNQDIEMLDFE
tara:strand:- start:320 stop:526 length:207 start_codon:yes stop_codon:yes gene_type:complete